MKYIEIYHINDYSFEDTVDSLKPSCAIRYNVKYVTVIPNKTHDAILTTNFYECDDSIINTKDNDDIKPAILMNTIMIIPTQSTNFKQTELIKPSSTNIELDIPNEYYQDIQSYLLKVKRTVSSRFDNDEIQFNIEYYDKHINPVPEQVVHLCRDILVDKLQSNDIVIKDCKGLNQTIFFNKISENEIYYKMNQIENNIKNFFQSTMDNFDSFSRTLDMLLMLYKNDVNNNHDHDISNIMKDYDSFIKYIESIRQELQNNL